MQCAASIRPWQNLTMREPLSLVAASNGNVKALCGSFRSTAPTHFAIAPLNAQNAGNAEFLQQTQEEMQT
jgi:hypothetical protein